MKYTIEHEYTQRYVERIEVEADTPEQARAIVFDSDELGNYHIVGDSGSLERTTLTIRTSPSNSQHTQIKEANP